MSCGLGAAGNSLGPGCVPQSCGVSHQDSGVEAPPALPPSSSSLNSSQIQGLCRGKDVASVRACVCVCVCPLTQGFLYPCVCVCVCLLSLRASFIPVWATAKQGQEWGCGLLGVRNLS
jgi:hypothetical protein